MYSDELVTWLIDTTASIVNADSRTNINDAGDRVDIADAHDETTYPFIGIVPISMTPLSGGLGNTEVVPTAIRDDNGFSGVEKTLRREFSIEITPVTDDDAAARDRLTDAVQLGFSTRADQGQIPADISEFSVNEGTSSGRTESFVRSNGVEVTGVLHTRNDVDLPAAETVSWSVDTEGTETPQTK